MNNEETSRRRPSAIARILTISAGLAGLLGAMAVAIGQGTQKDEASVIQERPAEHRPAVVSTAADASRSEGNVQLPDVDDLSRAFATVSRKLEPAVVNVFTEGTQQAVQPPSGTPFDDFFERFFRDQQQRPRTSLGSGVIVDPRGYLVTNNHVVENADEIEVQFSDERRFKAEIVGNDPPTDLAVLKIKSEETFPFVNFGDSDALVVGEWVLAIGNPFGFGHTVTAGIVSAKGRVINQGIYDDFIQTDAAINPGNSGGPLLDSAGRLIGINTAIFSPSGAYAGVGFAVPVDSVNRVVPQLIAKGSYARPVLGIQVDQALNEMLQKRLGVKGVAVMAVEPGSPAERAGLRPARIDRSGGIVP
ncbi:MAG TPA: trypsin-like peptidase domain-containing protein, partial [Vicinamibacteria bacterium]|nr:trypsin-like peptidase domain-containing protein [Vicinamibacteria bacterium]